eukprot:6207119-Pleurochrysis_carterae.AAC.1
MAHWLCTVPLSLTSPHQALSVLAVCVSIPITSRRVCFFSLHTPSRSDGRCGVRAQRTGVAPALPLAPAAATNTEPIR